MKVAAIIVCAGRGKRLGAGTDKAVVTLGGRPLFYHAVTLFQSAREIKEIVVVLRKKNFALAKRLFGPASRMRLVEGGRERQDSVRFGLRALSADVTHVLIHDGARPFASKRLITRVVKALKKAPAVICAVKAKDTVKTVSRGFVEKTLDRNRLCCVQTPQGFEKNLIIRAYGSEATRKVFDDAQILEKLKIPVKVIEGETTNFKITYPEEVRLAHGIITGKF